MAESESLEVDQQLTGEFRRRQHSFHSNMSKSAPKRPAAVPLDFAQPQRPRLEDDSLSVSAPIVRTIVETRVEAPTIDFNGVTADGLVDAPIEEAANGTNERAESSDSTVPSDMTDASSPALESPLGSLAEELEEVEGEEEEEEEPQRIVRPEDISLHNPDSGLGYRASKNEYHTDDSDDGHDDDDDVASERDNREVTDDLPSRPASPALEVEEVEEWIPQSPSPSKADPVEEVEEVVEESGEGAAEDTLPFNTPLDLECTFDPSIHMGLLMIDPSHQDRFNQLNNGFNSFYGGHGYNGFYGGNPSLVHQYENANAVRVQQMENALLLNTDFYEEVVEEIEVIEEEDYHPPNPPSSPANSQHE